VNRNNAFDCLRWVGIETPLPWKTPVHQSLPDRFQERFLIPYADELIQIQDVCLLLVAGEQTAVSDNTRVLVWEKQTSTAPFFEKTEYLIPTQRLSWLGIALTLRPQRLVEFEKWQIEPSMGKDHLLFIDSEVHIDQVDENGRIWRAAPINAHWDLPDMISFPIGSV